MIKINFNIRFFLKENGSVIARVRWAQKKCSVELGLGVFADPEKWDTVQQCSKPNTTHKVGDHTATARMINTRIMEVREYATEIFKRHELRGEYPTVIEFKDFMQEKLHPETKTQITHLDACTLEDLKAAYFREFEFGWRPRTKYRYAQAVTHAQSLNPKIRLEEIDKRFIQDLVAWHIDNNYNNETTNSRLDALKSMLRWGAQNGYKVKREAYETRTEILTPHKKVIFLHHDELMAFYEHKFDDSQATLNKYRDMWCFMAFTSLRYSDMQGLKTASITEDDFMEIYTEKTSEYLRIPLIPQAKAIIHKYVHTDGEYVFPRISDQKLNKYIKMAAESAGLDRNVVETSYIGREKVEITNPLYKTLSCHDARRTFVCCSLKFGIPAPTVMKMTGHEDYDSMKPYIDVADDTVQIEMKKWATKPEILDIISRLDSATPSQLKKISAILSPAEKDVVSQKKKATRDIIVAS